MISGPCKVDGIECPNRSTTCRSSCEYWEKYQDDLRTIREARIKDKTTNRAYWQIRNKGKPKSEKGESPYCVY